MTITISLSESDLERIHGVLGIESYDDIHTAFVDAMDIMLEKEEKFNEESNRNDDQKVRSGMAKYYGDIP